MADYWLKLYIEILDDPKMATLPDRVWRRIIELFLVAKRLGKDGRLPDTRQIAWMLRMSPDELEGDMAQIAQTGIAIREVNGWLIPKFAQRQAAVSDAERKAQERIRKRSQQYYENVTNRSRNVTQSTEDRLTEDRLTESEVDDHLLKAFYDESKLPIVDDWRTAEALQKIRNAGALEEDVRTAVRLLVEKKYNITGLQSIVNTVITNIGKRKRNGVQPRVSNPMDDADYANFHKNVGRKMFSTWSLQQCLDAMKSKGLEPTHEALEIYSRRVETEGIEAPKW